MRLDPAGRVEASEPKAEKRISCRALGPACVSWLCATFVWPRRASEQSGSERACISHFLISEGLPAQEHRVPALCFLAFEPAGLQVVLSEPSFEVDSAVVGISVPSLRR